MTVFCEEADNKENLEINNKTILKILLKFVFVYKICAC